MNNIFYEMIFKRKSFHLFRNVGNESIGEYELSNIQNAYSEFTPLNPEIKTTIRIIPEKETNCKRGGEYCILLYSENKDGYLQNIGYLGEQLKQGEIDNVNCSVVLPDSGWTLVKGKTAELDLIYQEIYAKGILKYEIESFTDEGECEILYYR